MANSLDMSLDDLIKGSKSNGKRGRGRGGGRGRPGRARGGPLNRGNVIGVNPRGFLKVNTRPSGYKFAKPVSRTKDLPWQNGMFEDSLVAAGYSAFESGTKLYVSNLDPGVTNEDIKELFSEIGELKRYAIYHDGTGRSNGSAEVVFTRKVDALAAMKRYNNVQLDGKAMKIEIIETNSGLPVSARVNVIGGVNGRGRRTVVMASGVRPPRVSGLVNRGGVRHNRGSGGSQRGRGSLQPRGRGRGRGRKQPTVKSADELDKDLENYHAEAMQTS